MKVLNVPYASGNPYQDLLAAALEKHGVQSQMANKFQRIPLLGTMLKFGKPDVLHLHWITAFWLQKKKLSTLVALGRFILELLIIKMLGIKIVWTMHDRHWADNPNPQFEYRLNRWFCRFIYDHIIVHCRAAQHIAQEIYQLPESVLGKMSVTGHGHFVGYYENRICARQARAQLGLASDDLVFLYFGMIRPYKGVFPLIDAFEQLAHPRAQLLIVGKPEDEATRGLLDERCRSLGNVHAYQGFVEDDDIQLYMNAADLTVLPFSEILTSRTVLLAMSFGKAVITPRVGCIAETLDDQGCLFYDDGQPGGLLQALQKAQSADLPAMGRHNLEQAKHFGWEEIGRKTYQAYARCLA